MKPSLQKAREGKAKDVTLSVSIAPRKATPKPNAGQRGVVMKVADPDGERVVTTETAVRRKTKGMLQVQLRSQMISRLGL